MTKRKAKMRPDGKPVETNLTADDQLKEITQFWIKDNPEGTLGQVADWLETAFQQTAQFDGDEIIEDVIDGPDMGSELYDYLQLWNAEGTGGEPHTIEYRVGNLECDQMTIQEYIDECGAETKVKEFL